MGYIRFGRSKVMPIKSSRVKHVSRVKIYTVSLTEADVPTVFDTRSANTPQNIEELPETELPDIETVKTDPKDEESSIKKEIVPVNDSTTLDQPKAKQNNVEKKKIHFKTKDIKVLKSSSKKSNSIAKAQKKKDSSKSVQTTKSKSIPKKTTSAKTITPTKSGFSSKPRNIKERIKENKANINKVNKKKFLKKITAIRPLSQ